MKRIVVFLGLIFLLFSNAYSIEVLNKDGDAQTYFSLNDDSVFVKSSINQPLRVSYTILNMSRYMTYLFEECGDEYCLDFELSDLIITDGGEFVSSKEFVLNQGDEIEIIYLDIEDPILTIDYAQIDKKDKQIDLKYTYSDDSNEIKKIDLYVEDNNNLNFIEEVSNRNEISIDIEDGDKQTVVFKIYDVAGNSYEAKKTIDVQDIFVPTIEKSILIVSQNGYQLEFEIKDANLSKYEIVQNNLVLSENLNGRKTYYKTINIPFKSGDVIFKVVDGKGNNVTKRLKLDSPITISYRDKYSANKRFEVKSNANKCFLTHVEGRSYQKDMKKSSNKFYYDLNIDDVKEYQVDYYCEYKGYREYFTSNFFYDTNEPTEPELSIKKLSYGNLELDWSESKDFESDVDYRLYRDDEVIYDGSKLSYEDSNVVYPNSYEYKVVAYDEAKNTADSNEVSEIPLKVAVSLTTSLNDEKSTFTKKESHQFSVQTDKNSNINVVVKNNGVIVDQQNLENIQSVSENFNVRLEEGVNQIEVTTIDEFENTESQTFFITYNQPVVEEIIEEEVVGQPAIEEAVNESIIVQENVEDNDDYKWIWFGIILILFVYFIWFFIFNEDKRKRNFYNKPKRTSVKRKGEKNKKDNINFVLDKLAKDKKLEKDFARIKKERITRQEERKQEQIRKAKYKEKQSKTTELQKKKLEDLKRKKEINIPLDARAKAKSKHKKVRKESTYGDELVSSKQKVRKTKRSFFSRKKLHDVEDEMSEYINRVKSTPSWNNPRDYVHKEIEPQPKDETPINNDSNPSKEIEEIENKRKFSFFNKNKKVEEKEEERVEEPKSEPVEEKVDVNEMLDGIVKKKKGRRFFLAEKSVDKDLSQRKNNF